MQSSIYLLLVTCLISAIYSTPAVAERFKILILGDSLSAAYNISMEQSWPYLFQQKLSALDNGHRVINASISGETSAGGLERLPSLLDKHQPTHLILELGGNDGLRGYQFKQTRQNLAQMIEMALAQKIQTLLIGVRLPPNLGPVYNQRFQRIYETLNEQFDVAFLPRFLQGIAADRPDFMQADGIHPTSVAQPLLADKVFNSFKSSFIQ